MHDPTDAAKARDFITIYSLALQTPALDLPFSGPDRAAFYFIDRGPEAAREGIAAARQVFGEIFGVTFAWRDVWTENGARRHYAASLTSGLSLVLVAKAAHMRDEALEDAGRELAEVA
jgi:hypothetical protein